MAAAPLDIRARHRHNTVLRKKRVSLFPCPLRRPLAVDFLAPMRSREPVMKNEFRLNGPSQSVAYKSSRGDGKRQTTTVSRSLEAEPALGGAQSL